MQDGRGAVGSGFQLLVGLGVGTMIFRTHGTCSSGRKPYPFCRHDCGGLQCPAGIAWIAPGNKRILPVLRKLTAARQDGRYAVGESLTPCAGGRVAAGLRGGVADSATPGPMARAKGNFGGKLRQSDLTGRK